MSISNEVTRYTYISFVFLSLSLHAGTFRVYSSSQKSITSKRGCSPRYLISVTRSLRYRDVGRRRQSNRIVITCVCHSLFRALSLLRIYLLRPLVASALCYRRTHAIAEIFYSYEEPVCNQRQTRCRVFGNFQLENHSYVILIKLHNCNCAIALSRGKKGNKK